MSKHSKALGIASVMVLQIAACSYKKSESGAIPRSGAPNAVGIDWRKVEQAMGRTGVPQPGGVYRFSMPRSDLAVTVQGVRLLPAFALGSWIAFKATGDGALAMGDLVLLETEIAPVMSSLQEAGIEQTAVHHHVLYETPRVVYMHVHGHGDPIRIAEGIRRTLALTGTPAPSSSSNSTAAFDIDTARIATALGHTGRVNGSVYQVTVPRAETIRDAGVEIPPSMGLGTVMNFQSTGGGRAAITGDFVMTATEVNRVIRALRQNGIEVTSLHNHLLNDEPRLFFMHFWANDDAVKLARGLRAALNATNSQQGSR